jgi:hypothetical protein
VFKYGCFGWHTSVEKRQKKLPFGVVYFSSENHGNKPIVEGILPWKKHGNMHNPLIREKTRKYGTFR